MEYAAKGELFSYITDKRKLEETEASFFYAQIITGIEYIHKNRITHRDLKPENILISEEGLLKIIDFGLSNKYQVGQLLSTACGSPCYAAPEMILGQKYKGVLSDIWSSGIILFAMVCGYLPFEDENNEIIYQKVLGGIHDLPQYLSPGCKDLIRKLLTVNPNKRIPIDEIKVHLFLQDGFERYNVMINQGNCNDDNNKLQIDKINDTILDQMLLLPSSLLSISNSKKEKMNSTRLIDVIDKDSLIKELLNNKYTGLTMTYKIFNNRYTRINNTKAQDEDNENIINNNSTCIINLSTSNATSFHSPYSNSNEVNSLIKESKFTKDKDSTDDATTPKQSETLLLDGYKNNTKQTNTNEEIQDSIVNKVLSHSFKNSFLASKRKKSEPINKDNGNNNCNHLKSSNEVTTHILITSIENVHQEDKRAVSLEVSNIVKKNQINSNVILTKSALNPLFKTKKNKFKRNNIMNQYLQSASLTNRITNINQMIDNSIFTGELKTKEKNKQILRSSFIPLNTINLNEPIICNTISHETKNKTEANRKPQSNTGHKRAKSARLTDALMFNNHCAISPCKNDEKREDKGNKYELKKTIGKEMIALHQYQPSFSNRIKYDNKIQKKTAHLSIIDSEVLYIDNTQRKKGEISKKNRRSMESQRNQFRVNKSKEQTDKVYNSTEGVNQNSYKTSNSKMNSHYRNNQKSPNLRASINNKRQVISPRTFIHSKQSLTSHYLNGSNTSNDINSNKKCVYNNTNTIPKKISKTTAKNPFFLSPKEKKTKIVLSSIKSKNAFEVTNSKAIENKYPLGIIKKVQLNMKDMNNDFAVCSTKLSLIEIKEKLYVLCKENSYLIKEVSIMPLIID